MSQPGAKLTPDVTAYFSPLGWFSVRPTPRFERDLKDWRGVRLGIEVPLQTCTSDLERRPGAAPHMSPGAKRLRTRSSMPTTTDEGEGEACLHKLIVAGWRGSLALRPATFRSKARSARSTAPPCGSTRRR